LRTLIETVDQCFPTLLNSPHLPKRDLNVGSQKLISFYNNTTYLSNSYKSCDKKAFVATIVATECIWLDPTVVHDMVFSILNG
jgi:hypothetical protein